MVGLELEQAILWEELKKSFVFVLLVKEQVCVAQA